MMERYHLFFPVLLGLLCFAPAAHGQQQRKPAVLFVQSAIEGFGHLDYKAAREWEQAGFAIDECLPDDLTWEKVKQFNVLVLQGAGVTGNDYKLLPYMVKNESLFARFLQAGGGIFFDPHVAEAPTTMPPIYSFGDKYGVTPLIEEITDPANQRISGGWSVSYVWTDVLTPHPITQGVKGIWYPIGRRKIYPFTMPLQVDAHWKVLLSTKESTASIPFSTYTPQIDVRARKEGYRGSFPICARSRRRRTYCHVRIVSRLLLRRPLCTGA